MTTDHNTAQGEQSISIVRTFPVAPSVVFDAFTEPGAMRTWWTDDTTFNIDLRVGGKWEIIRKEGDETYIMLGEYLEVERPHRVQYTIGVPESWPNADTITIDIQPHSIDGSDGAQMTYTHSGAGIGAELEELPDGEVSATEEGWQYGFDLLAAAWGESEQSKSG